MRMIYPGFLLLIASIPGFSQHPLSCKGTPMISREKVLAIRSGMIPLPVKDTTEVKITGNCWGAVNKPLADTGLNCARGQSGALIISTKKVKTREFEIIDVQEGNKIAGATVTFTDVKNKHERLAFAADHNGRITTDKLNAPLYELEVSAVGYKTTRLGWCCDSSNRKTLFLVKDFIECAPIVVVSGGRKRRGCPGSRVSKLPATYSNPQPIEKKMPAVKIFPNPLPRGQSFTIELKNTLPGEISARMISVDGRQLLIRSFRKKENNSYTIETDARWVAGAYFIQLINTAGALIRTEQVVIL